MPNPYAPPETEPVPERDPEPHHPVADPPSRRPSIRATEDFVSVYTANSVIEAEMLTQVLEAEGIATPGFNRADGAHVGLGLMGIGHVIRVPRSEQAVARELIEAFLKGSPNELPPEPDEYEELGPRPRSKSMTVMALIVLAPMVIGALLMVLGLVASLFQGR